MRGLMGLDAPLLAGCTTLAMGCAGAVVSSPVKYGSIDPTVLVETRAKVDTVPFATERFGPR